MAAAFTWNIIICKYILVIDGTPKSLRPALLAGLEGMSYFTNSFVMGSKSDESDKYIDQNGNKFHIPNAGEYSHWVCKFVRPFKKFIGGRLFLSYF